MLLLDAIGGGLSCDRTELRLAVQGQVGTRGRYSRTTRVGVFVRASLPWRSRVTKVEPFGERASRSPGEGRTLEAIKQMMPTHAVELNLLGRNARTMDLPDGVTLTVTTSDASQLQSVKGLGFIGIMVLGTHHQMHQWIIAKGAVVH